MKYEAALDAAEMSRRALGSDYPQPQNTPMTQYQCHKKVWALKIQDVIRGKEGDDESAAIIVPDDRWFSPFFVSNDFVEKHSPEAGGYLVWYADGYRSYSPAEAFEDGYSRVPDGAVRIPADAIPESPHPKRKPSAGRIVIYKHPGSADGKYPPQESPAIIQHVDEDAGKENVKTLGHRLWVFGPQGIFWVNAFEGEGPCEWRWPTKA